MQESGKNFLLLLTGQIVSMFGSSVYLVVVILYIKELTGMAAALGIFQFAAYLPIVLLAPIGGVLADNTSRKNMIVAADLLRGLIMIALGTLLLNGLLSYFILLVGTILVSVCSALFHPAAHALFPQIVSAETLRRKNAVKTTILLGANVTGSSLGGGAYFLFGPAAVFIFNGSTFLMSAVEESFIKPPRYRTKTQPQRTPLRLTICRQTTETIGYLKRERGITAILIAYSLINGLYPPVVISLPFLIENRYGLAPLYFGPALALLLFGGATGALLFGFMKVLRRSAQRLFFTSLWILSILLLTAGLSRVAAVLFALLPVAGACIGLLHQIMTTTLYRKVEAESRGRIFGMMEAFASFAVPVSYALGGILVQLTQNRLAIFYTLMAGLTGTLAALLHFSTHLGVFISAAETGSIETEN